MPEAPATIVDSVPLPPAVTAAYVPHDVPFSADAALWLLPLLLVTTFLLGSVPWGVIVSQLAFHKDIRAEGSGNIGTTNAMRTLGKAGGTAVFALDFGKGLLAGWLGSMTAEALPSGFAALALALAFAGCTWGHIFSPWLGFRGGKGIAVAAACLWFTFGPVGFLVEVGVFAVVVALTRYVSAGSVSAAVACLGLAALYYGGHPVAMALIMAAALTVVWAHRGNIARLRAGTERRIGGRRAAAGAEGAAAGAAASGDGGEAGVKEAREGGAPGEEAREGGPEAALGSDGEAAPEGAAGAGIAPEGEADAVANGDAEPEAAGDARASATGEGEMAGAPADAAEGSAAAAPREERPAAPGGEGDAPAPEGSAAPLAEERP